MISKIDSAQIEAIRLDFNKNNKQDGYDTLTRPTLDIEAYLMQQNQLRTIYIDQINFVRLSLLYIDDISQQIGLEFVKKCRETISSSYRAFERKEMPEEQNFISIPSKQPQILMGDTQHKNTESAIDMRKYCESNAIFFYNKDKVVKRLIPKRNDSSRVTLNGFVRRRGSMLNLLYSVPNLEEIQQTLEFSQSDTLIASRTNKKHNNINQSHRKSSDLSLVGSCSDSFEQEDARQMASDIQNELQQKVPQRKLSAQFDHAQLKNKLIMVANISGGRQEEYKQNLAFYQRSHEQIDKNKQFHKSKKFQGKTIIEPSTPQNIINQSSQNLKYMGRFRGSEQNILGDLMNDHSAGLVARRSYPLTKMSKIGRHGSFSTLCINTPMKKLISKKLSVQGYTPTNGNITDQELPYNFTLTTPLAYDTTGNNIVVPMNGINDIGSMSSDIGSWNEASIDIKAFQFFSKENTTKINIGQQKMLSWKEKMKKENNKSNKELQLQAGKNNVIPDVVFVSSFSQQESPTVTKWIYPNSAVYPKLDKFSEHNTSSEFSSKNSSLAMPKKNSLIMGANKNFDRRRSCVQPRDIFKSNLKTDNNSVQVPPIHQSDYGICSPQQASRKETLQSLRSQCFQKNKIEALREKLEKATWEQDEEDEAEIRYDRFLMLQSLAKRMKRFYKFEFGHIASGNTTINKTTNNDSSFMDPTPHNSALLIASKFQKASTFVRNLDRTQQSGTPSCQRSDRTENLIDSGDSSCSSSLDEMVVKLESLNCESRNSIASVKIEDQKIPAHSKKRKVPKIDISLNDTAGRDDEEDRFESSPMEKPCKNIIKRQELLEIQSIMSSSLCPSIVQSSYRTSVSHSSKSDSDSFKRERSIEEDEKLAQNIKLFKPVLPYSCKQNPQKLEQILVEIDQKVVKRKKSSQLRITKQTQNKSAVDPLALAQALKILTNQVNNIEVKNKNNQQEAPKQTSNLSQGDYSPKGQSTNFQIQLNSISERNYGSEDGTTSYNVSIQDKYDRTQQQKPQEFSKASKPPRVIYRYQGVTTPNSNLQQHKDDAKDEDNCNSNQILIQDKDEDGDIYKRLMTQLELVELNTVDEESREDKSSMPSCSISRTQNNNVPSEFSFINSGNITEPQNFHQLVKQGKQGNDGSKDFFGISHDEDSKSQSSNKMNLYYNLSSRRVSDTSVQKLSTAQVPSHLPNFVNSSSSILKSEYGFNVAGLQQSYKTEIIRAMRDFKDQNDSKDYDSEDQNNQSKTQEQIENGKNKANHSLPSKMLKLTNSDVKKHENLNSFNFDEEKNESKVRKEQNFNKSENESQLSPHRHDSNGSLITSNKMSSMRKSRMSLTASDEEYPLGSEYNSSTKKLQRVVEKNSQASPQHMSVDSVGLRSKYASNQSVTNIVQQQTQLSTKKPPIAQNIPVSPLNPRKMIKKTGISGLDLSPLIIVEPDCDQTQTQLSPHETKFLQRSLSPCAARAYVQSNSDDEDENLDNLKKLFRESATKGDQLIKRLAENNFNTIQHSQTMKIEPSTTVNRNMTSKVFFSQNRPTQVSKSFAQRGRKRIATPKKSDTMLLDVQTSQSEMAALNEALTVALGNSSQSPIDQRNLGASLHYRSSTSAAYRKAQDFQERRSNSMAGSDLGMYQNLVLVRGNTEEKQTRRRNQHVQRSRHLREAKQLHFSANSPASGYQDPTSMNLQLQNQQMTQQRQNSYQIVSNTNNYLGVAGQQESQDGGSLGIQLNDVLVRGSINIPLSANPGLIRLNRTQSLDGPVPCGQTVSKQPSISSFQLTLRSVMCSHVEDANGGEPEGSDK